MRQGVVGAGHLVQLLPALIQVFQHLLHCGAVFLFQPVQQVASALHGIQLPGPGEIPRWAMFARLPLQFLMIWAVLAGTRPTPVAGAAASTTAATRR